MELLFNLLWIVFGGGFLIAIQYAFGGAVLCLTVVGIPFGLQCFKLAELALFPFGKKIEDEKSGISSGGLGLLMNVLWIIFAGWSLFLSHVVLGLGLAATIIGIPFALQHLKLAVLSLVPFGRKIVEG